jgi:cytochrome c biogenesis protein CcmG/thiol:disulfide interchange protein DsbE
MADADFPSVIDRDGRKAVEWGVFGVPETFLVDPDGRIVRKTVGVLTEQWVAEYVVPLLES